MSKKQNAKKNKTNNKTKKILGRIWRVICWPFRKIADAGRVFWKWICKVNIIGLTNVTLLVAIITLFSMLILDVLEHNHNKAIVTKLSETTKPQITITDKSAPKMVKLPLSQNTKSNSKFEDINRVVPVNQTEMKIVRKQIAKQNKTMFGNIIIDSRSAGALLQNKTQIKGNLYLQNMHKYVLPCGIKINGSLYLRDVNKLQFCGDFTITGNIYVSPRSSFGPIPKTARLGGQVIL